MDRDRSWITMETDDEVSLIKTVCTSNFPNPDTCRKQISFDEGKTWTPDDGDTGKSSVHVTWEKVYKDD